MDSPKDRREFKRDGLQIVSYPEQDGKAAYWLVPPQKRRFAFRFGTDMTETTDVLVSCQIRKHGRKLWIIVGVEIDDPVHGSSHYWDDDMRRKYMQIIADRYRTIGILAKVYDGRMWEDRNGANDIEFSIPFTPEKGGALSDKAVRKSVESSVFVVFVQNGVVLSE